MEKMLMVSSSPHVKAEHTTRKIMLDVVIALMPALIAGIYFFGVYVLFLTVVSVGCCVGFEWIWEKVFKRTITIGDLSAVVTGVLLAYNVPARAPVYIIVIGAFVSIILAKQVFGGIGQNFINPALAARAFLLAGYSTDMRSFPVPEQGRLLSSVDAVTGATPLELMKNGALDQLPSLTDAFLGNIGGCIGEVSALALLIGGIYLIIRKVITWHIPVCYIGSIFVLTTLLNGFDFYQSFYSLFLGGVMLGGFFMATDYTTTPMTIKGQIIFALGAGMITTLIRLFGGYPEGVSYSILIMNLVVPLIDKYVKVRRFGEVV
ncbi:MAG: RnfABCDGE type electron transport complex subunit D [Cellulosilyticum sp.]|nr:RnfABCDGE type electron transport complex subunit D [Cellulosilyticum sp.]MEE1071222.1 RnfABCDGE type electron transport complex subunit D [Cellulosilyticum sp.]